MQSIKNQEFNCDVCLSKYRGRSDEAKMQAASRAAKGCQTVGSQNIHFIGTDLGFATCVGNFVSNSAVSWIELHAHFERGVMPYPGGLMDQPAKAVEIFRIIEVWKIEMRREAQAKSEAMARRGKRGG